MKQWMGLCITPREVMRRRWMKMVSHCRQIRDESVNLHIRIETGRMLKVYINSIQAHTPQAAHT